MNISHNFIFLEASHWALFFFPFHNFVDPTLFLSYPIFAFFFSLPLLINLTMRPLHQRQIMGHQRWTVRCRPTPRTSLLATRFHLTCPAQTPPVLPLSLVSKVGLRKIVGIVGDSNFSCIIDRFKRKVFGSWWTPTSLSAVSVRGNVWVFGGPTPVSTVGREREKKKGS